MIDYLYKNCQRMLGDLGKLIVPKGFIKLPKVQKIARSGHTGSYLLTSEKTILAIKPNRIFIDHSDHEYKQLTFETGKRNKTQNCQNCQMCHRLK